MEIVVPQADLKDALDTVKKASSSKSYLPSMSSVLLDASDGLSLRCTDLEMYIQKKISAQVKSSGQALLPVTLLSEFVGSLPSDRVTLSADSKKANVKCGRFESNVKSLDPDDFPAPPKVEPSITIDAEAFKKAIGRVTHAAAADDARPVLQGILLDGKIAAAADGFRMAIANLEMEGVKAIVPARALKEAVRVLSGTVNIGVNSNMMVLSDGTTEIGTRLIEGNYPPLERVIPSGDGTQIVVDVAPLLNALKSASIFARENSNIVRFSAEDDTLLVSSTSAETGDTTATLDSENSGAIKFALNVRYLTDLLSVIGTDKARFSVADANAAVLIRGDEDAKYVIMPMASNK